MIRLGTLFWLVLVSATGFAMFGVKYQVQVLEDELARTNRATATEEHELRVLEAEWAYLDAARDPRGDEPAIPVPRPVGNQTASHDG